MPTDIILYELEVKDDSDAELVFMMNEELGPITPLVSELDNITLGDIVGREIVFSPEHIDRMKKISTVKENKNIQNFMVQLFF